MEDLMRNSRKPRFILLALLMAMIVALPAAAVDGNLMYQSPLYSSSASYPIASFLEQNRYTSESFASQMGLTPEEMVRIASNSSSYRIVPGDSFTLSYYSGNEVVTSSFQVSSLMTVDIPEVGTFDCRGMSFAQLREDIKEMVLQARPYSSPHVDLVACGFFEVPVVGEVSSSVPVRCWGGSTLRCTMANASSYASSRSVQVKRADGTSLNYDLYKGISTGDMVNDPNLRPGDTVCYSKATCIVVLAGAVYSPGTYQLLPGEKLGDLIRSYGNGLLPSADSSAISVEHVSGGKAVSTLASDTENSLLSNMDRVTVVETNPAASYVTVEGAVAPVQTSSDSAVKMTSASKLMYSFLPGEKVSQMLKAISGAFVSQSDLDNIYIIRGSQKIMLESGKLLSGQSAADPVLEAGDKIVVPFVQTFVTVNGSVNAPGRIAYVPDKDASYYIGLSGGYSNTASGVGSYKVTDSAGKKIDKDGLVPNGAVISVNTNNISRDVTLVAAVVAVAASIASLLVDINSLIK